jgi:HD superfamily phosphohydrolase
VTAKQYYPLTTGIFLLLAILNLSSHVRLDVDKIDYLLRDSVSIGEPCPDFLSRLLDNIRGKNALL